VTALIAIACAAAAAGVTWLLARRILTTTKREESDPRRPAPTGRATDGDPTPVPITPETGPEIGPTWASVVDRIPLGVVVMARRGDVRYRNLRAKTLAGTHTGLLIDDAVQSALRQALTGENTREVLEFYGPPQVAVVVTAESLPDGSAVATVEDVSDRRRVDAMRTDFVANISHELKTPVGALAVLAEALVDEDDITLVRRVAERMVGEAHRVARTVDDLMELSRIELGEEPVRDTVGVLDIVSGAIDRAAALAENRQIHVAVLDIPEGVAVVGDRRQLISALGNLVENAVKYSEPGGHVQIRVRVEGDCAELMVADQGIGIPAADHGRIFERFYRVDKARSRDTGGTGLGLSIVRHVATRHGGEVLVSSQEGEGSTFVMRLPLASSPNVEPSHMSDSDADPQQGAPSR
jgi:two-component system sensor histidine kinase SenX3